MGIHFTMALLGGFLATGWALAQEQGKKDGPRSNLAEVRFEDGSVVRMTILQQNLEVMTKYGKLIIPVNEIRRIDFGVHLPEGMDETIQSHIQEMGSDVYKRREEAAKELVNIGVLAYPSLQRAARSSDQEVALRAQNVIKKISDKVPAENIRTKEDDFIQTVEFTLVGRIKSPAIRAHSTHFGESDLKLSELRTIHLRGGGADSDLAVDAAKYGSALDQWLDTGLVVDSSLRLIIQSEGLVDLWPQGPGQYVTGPKGYTTAGKGGQYMAGALLGRIGAQGKIFYVGERYEGVPQDEGKLYLHIVPSPWNNASTGTYRVRLRADYVALSSNR